MTYLLPVICFQYKRAEKSFVQKGEKLRNISFFLFFTFQQWTVTISSHRNSELDFSELFWTLNCTYFRYEQVKMVNFGKKLMADQVEEWKGYVYLQVLFFYFLNFPFFFEILYNWLQCTSCFENSDRLFVCYFLKRMKKNKWILIYFLKSSITSMWLIYSFIICYFQLLH